MILTVTGHRPDKLGGYEPNPIQSRVRGAVTGALTSFKRDFQPFGVITGMALGVDQWVAEACIGLEIPFLAAVPSPTQSAKWPRDSRAHYIELLRRARHVHIVSPTYEEGCEQVRNAWMIDRGNVVLGVWNGTPGGTANALSYAHSKHRPIVLFNPETSKWHMVNL